MRRKNFHNDIDSKYTVPAEPSAVEKFIVELLTHANIRSIATPFAQLCLPRIDAPIARFITEHESLPSAF
jgi:hypothetical protein